MNVPFCYEDEVRQSMNDDSPVIFLNDIGQYSERRW